ncbi:MAG: cytochrome C oxidase subunit IV family protein [Ignavibacteriae bacterium]|nr:cytochrome C oxidase subunit IV family protein [Ignavibacteriota bacterium]
MEHSHAEIKKHVRKYIFVFVALMALTVVTVAVSYLHLTMTTAVIVALFIASIKGALVAGYFMHLISEKKVIYLTLAFTLFFFIGMIVLTMSSISDQVMMPHVS